MRSRRQRGSAKRVVFEGGRADILERTFEQTVVLRSWRDERAVDDLARVARDKVRLLLAVGGRLSLDEQEAWQVAEAADGQGREVTTGSAAAQDELTREP